MTYPYAIVSDLHAHAWSAFATALPSGVNSRLQIIIDELHRAAQELAKRGGRILYVAGDVFHVRGSIDPEVFNPVHEAIAEIVEDGIEIRIIPGNHDLKGRSTTELGNAVQTIGSLSNVEVVANPNGRLFTDTSVLMIPWQATKNDLRELMKDVMEAYPEEQRDLMDLIIHVGIDGVLAGVPDLGLSAQEVASWGFKRVFAGDYHNHKVMEGGKVISIGATTHQNWGDIGTKAGFLLVYEDYVEFQASHAPSFIELNEDDDPEEYPLIVDGNYVRVRGLKMTDSEITAMRKELMGMGAKGVSFQVARETVSARGMTSVAKASTLDESVSKFIDTMSIDDPAVTVKVKEIAADVLSTIRSVTA